MAKNISYYDIPTLTKDCNYKIDVGMYYLEELLSEYYSDYNLDMNPEFQRGHRWSHDQQVAFVEYFIKGGYVSPILFNCPNWNKKDEGNMVLVDGLQRLTAIRLFIDNSLQIFGHYTKDKILNIPNRYLKFAINNILSYVEVLKWYIELNSGTAHTKEELDRVSQLITTVKFKNCISNKTNRLREKKS